MQPRWEGGRRGEPRESRRRFVAWFGLAGVEGRLLPPPCGCYPRALWARPPHRRLRLAPDGAPQGARTLAWRAALADARPRPGHRALAEWRGRDTPGTRPVGMPTTRPPASSSGTVSTPRPRAAWTSTASTGPSRTTLAHSCGRPCSTPTARRSLRMSIRTRSRRGGAGSHRPRRLAPKPRLLPRDRARQAGPTSRLRESGVSQVIGAILHDWVCSLSPSPSPESATSLFSPKWFEPKKKRKCRRRC